MPYTLYKIQELIHIFSCEEFIKRFILYIRRWRGFKEFYLVLEFFQLDLARKFRSS